METQPQQKTSKNHVWVWLVAFVIVAGSLFAAVYYWNEAQEAREDSTEAVEQRNLEETQQVVGSLGQVLLLSDENPTVARVEDPEILKQSNPDFYENIQAGDYLVLYPQRAIIYRASETKIINIAPIVNTDQLRQSQEEQATQPEVEDTQSSEQ